ncbi:MAG: TonB-dependent receptor [Pseudomonadota bacterium]
MSNRVRTAMRRKAIALAVASVAAGSPNAFAQLEEVIVTAQKREEGLQDVPISVEAFSQAQIEGLAAQDIADLAVFTPNFDAGLNANQPRYKIRGIGTDDFGIGADPAVGVYQDGVYIGRSGGSRVAFNDVQRVEILNGPQGTLFGRNAAAGAVQYVTYKPSEETEGWIRGIYGNYDRRQVDGVYNTPITDNLFFRGGVLVNKRDGWVDNEFNGRDLARQDNWSVNAQLKWLPTDTLDINFRLEYDEVDQDSAPASSAVWGPRDNGAGFEKVESDANLEESRELWGAALHVTWDLSWATFYSITSWREFESLNPEEKDGSADPLYYLTDLNQEDNEQFGQEFRFDGDLGSNVRWTAGFNYHYENAKQLTGIDLLPQAIDKLAAEVEIGLPYDAVTPGDPLSLAFLAFPDPEGRREYSSGQDALARSDFYSERLALEGTYDSYAVFGDVTWDITDTISLTGGLRWTRDEKEFSRFTEFNEYVIAFAFTQETRIDANGNYDPDGQIGWLTTEDSWSQTTPRLVLDWAVAEDVLLYASYAEGYKAGGFNSAGEILAPSFDPEEVTNYELGMKSSWLDNTLRVNLSLFYYEYDNLQSLEFIDAECLPNSSVGAYLFETSDVEGDGLELSVNWLATPNLELFFNTGLLDAEYVRREERRVIDGVCQTIDRTGETFAESPDLNFTVGGTYSWPFNDGSELVFTAAYNYEEGTEQNNCTFIVNPDDPADPSALYELTELNGELIVSRQSSFGPEIEAPFSSCPDTDDIEQLNMRLTWFSPASDWEVSAWVVNATDWEPDEKNPGNLGDQLASDFSDGSPSFVRREEPRMYGVELRYRW